MNPTLLLIIVCTLCPATGTIVRQQQASAHDASKSESTASPEEKIIRAAYDKLVLYNRAAALEAARGDDDAVTADSILKFELKNFHTGPLDEIRNLSKSDVVTIPSGDVIRITPISYTYNDEPAEAGYVAVWDRRPNTEREEPESTLGDTFNIAAKEFFDVGKYTSYEVTVAFNGKRRTYRALVVFHNRYEPTNPRLEFWDDVGAGGVLSDVFTLKYPPLKKYLKTSKQKT